MRTIETRATVSADGKLTIDVPADVTPGEHQVVVVIVDLPSTDLATIAQHGGSLDWLSDEPDLYTDKDGEPLGDRSQTTNADILTELGLVALPWRAWPEYATFRREEIYGDDGR